MKEVVYYYMLKSKIGLLSFLEGNNRKNSSDRSDNG